MTDRPHYTWNYVSCATDLRATDRCGEINLAKSILPNQSCQINLAKSILPNQSCQSILARSTQVPASLARLTNVGLHSSFSTLVVHTNQVPVATHQVPLVKSEKKDSLSNEQHVLTILKI